jgi:esterase/lipase superfamily enzyme
MKLFEENKEAVLGIVTLPRRNPDTFGRDIRDMLTQKLTFEEVVASDRWSIMAKSRIAAVQRDLYEQLEAVLG